MAAHGDIEIVRRKMPGSNVEIKGLPQRIKDALGTSADSLFVSPNNMAKQFKNHSDLTPKEYLGVFGRMKRCKEIYDCGATRVALVLREGAWYKLILKTTEDRSEGLHRVNEEHSLARIRRRPRIL